jgi:phage-related protein
MASIYEIPNWSGGITASKNDVYFHLSNHFYSLESSNTETPSVGASKWGGVTTFDNKVIPHFFWIPSYAPTISTEPTVKSVRFGDGYEQRTPEGLSTRLLKVALTFDKRSEKETTAISHFLHERGGAEAFAYLPPSPYSSMKKFICRKWDVTMNFENNYSIKVDLEEVVS